MISVGGPQSLHEPAGLDWLEPELELLRHAVAGDVPVYGVCLGAQLLALAFGGEVYAGGAPEVGPAPVFRTDAARDDAVFGGLPDTVPAFHWHADTFTLPADAVLAAATRELDAVHEVARQLIGAWLDVCAAAAPARAQASTS